jgi:carbon-monoxide dehydrogenase medium subunit
LLAEVRLPLLPDGTGGGFAEHRHTHAKYAEVAVIAAVTVTDGVVSAAAIGLVNIGRCPVRARAAEAALIGFAFSDAAITEAAEAAADLAAGRQGHVADPQSRRRTVKVLTWRALTQAQGRT